MNAIKITIQAKLWYNFVIGIHITTGRVIVISNNIARYFLPGLIFLAALFVNPGKTEALRLITAEVTILNETPIYGKPDPKSKPIGTLAPMQSLSVDRQTPEIDPPTLLTETGDWIRVNTWLGPCWIKDNDNVIYGTLTEEAREVTIMNTAGLYHSPKSDTKTGQSLSPQKVKITAKLGYIPKNAVNAISVELSRGTWYRVQTTWMGEKWIVNPAILEDVKEMPASMQIKLTEAEMAYPVRYADDGEGEIVPPGAINVIATSTEGFGPWSTTWYKAQLPQGVRWIRPKHQILTDYREMDETVQLTTAARYFDEPMQGLDTDNNRWLPEGNYQAIEASGSWIHLETPFGPKWVNRDRILVERPEGIVPTSETVELTDETETYYFPDGESVCHTRGFFAPQLAQAFEKWESGDGFTWYRIHTFSGEEWVRVIK